MLLKITSVQNKTNDWKVVGYETPEGGVVAEASINRTDKSGVPFPDFDGIVVGREIDGNPWRNPTNGKWSIFPPKPASTGSFKRSGGAITKAMEKKEESISKFQDNKELSIKVASTMRDAVSLAIAEYTHNQQYPLDELVVKWRGWLWNQHDKTSPDDLIPF